MLSITDLPDELLHHILQHLDVPELFATSRTSQRLRSLSLDPLLHQIRLRSYSQRVNTRLSKRPPLYQLQPPNSTIYLTRTHVAARRLHWSLVCIRLNRSLARRPNLSTLVSANILPKECCGIDRRSGEFVLGTGVAGTLVERRRKVEREKIKEGLKVWLERKARQIPYRRKDGSVGVLVWRFTKRMRLNPSSEDAVDSFSGPERPKKEKVNGLKRFWENLNTTR